MKHDEGCQGCLAERRRASNPGVAPVDLQNLGNYQNECSKCGDTIPARSEHLVRGKIYCVKCAPIE